MAANSRTVPLAVGSASVVGQNAAVRSWGEAPVEECADGGRPVGHVLVAAVVRGPCPGVRHTIGGWAARGLRCSMSCVRVGGRSSTSCVVTVV